MEMREEDQPPEGIWLDGEAINDHMERIQEKYRSPDSGRSEEVDLDQNEWTRDIRGR